MDILDELFKPKKKTSKDDFDLFEFAENGEKYTEYSKSLNQKLYDVVIEFTKDPEMRELLFDHIDMAILNNKKSTPKMYLKNLKELKENVPNFEIAKKIVKKAAKQAWRYVWYEGLNIEEFLP